MDSGKENRPCDSPHDSPEEPKAISAESGETTTDQKAAKAIRRSDADGSRKRWTAGKRAAVFVAVTFVLTWAVEFGIIWPLAGGNLVEGGNVATGALTGGIMFIPAIGVLLARLITREGMRDAWFKPVQFKRTWKWWIAAWLGTVVLIAVGAVVYFAVFPGDFDPSMSASVAGWQQLYEEMGYGSFTEGEIRIMLYAGLASALFVSLVNVIPAFGEEWGWRGYLLPKLLGRFHVLPAMLIMGVIWGLWHLPLTVMGHNYGVGYVGYPVLGIVAMCWMCVCVGVFFAYLTLRTGTCIPAAIGHAMFNGCASAGIMFSATGGNLFAGPLPTGMVGCVGFTVVAVVVLVSLSRRERAGLPISVRSIETEREA